MDSHLGYRKRGPGRDGGGNSCDDYRAEAAPSGAAAPKNGARRDRRDSSEPRVTADGPRRMAEIDNEVISLAAKGLTTSEVQAHLAEIYGAPISRRAIDNITGRALEGMAEWCDRPLERVYALLFVDAVHVKIRGHGPTAQPVYLALGVTVDGERDILGLWAGAQSDGEDAGSWEQILTEIRNRGAEDVLIVVCDEIEGLPNIVSEVWAAAITQTRIVHLLRYSIRHASERDWAGMAGDLKPVYSAANAADALDRFVDFSHRWKAKYPRIVRLWQDAWPEFAHFLALDRDVRTVIIATIDVVDRLTARLRRSVEARGHFPTEQAALRFIYLVIISFDPNGHRRRERSNRWEDASRAFDNAFGGRLSAARRRGGGKHLARKGAARRYTVRPRWLKLALGVAIVLAIGIWDVGLPGRQAQSTGHAARPSPSAHATTPVPVPGVLTPKGPPDFSATFAGSHLDTSVWATCYPWMDSPTGCNNSGNHEYEWYLPSQDRVSGGVLHLDARQAPTAGQAQDGSPEEYACRSGMVTTYPGFRFKYGYLQVVARFPASPGMWPAIWLAAANLHWPPEIDIIEGWDKGSPYTGAYFHPAGGGGGLKRDKAVIPPRQAIGWHTFAVSWTKTQVTWLLDGRAVLTARQHIPHVKMYLIADLAESDPVHAAQCHGSMLIRSVKVWKN